MEGKTNKCTAIYFYQKPFTADTEQMGCYYFNILQAVELCRMWGAAIVPPKLPLAPRDNNKVELDHTQPWDDSILELGSIDSTEVLDYSTVNTMTFVDFCSQSNLNVYSDLENLDISGSKFKNDMGSKYFIMNMSPRWDTNKYNSNTNPVFYTKIYKTLPFKNQVYKERVPEWYLDMYKAPFLGVHWRRGDRGNACLGVYGKNLWYATEPDKVAMYINTYLEKNKDLIWVYVSTNSGSIDDRELLQRLVKVPLYYLEVPDNIEPLEMWKWDLTDLFMCAKAKHLILSPGGLKNSSAFGRILLAESMKQNIGETKSHFMSFI
jgi:hypothetical protein